MFGTAQFFPVHWMLQAGLRSVFCLGGTAEMVSRTYSWVKIERLTWVLYGWVILMLLGLVLTDLGIFLGWEKVLANLCPLWLGMRSLGYLGTGFAVPSRAFSSKFLSPVGDFNFALQRRLVFPIYRSRNGI
jgi:hypothetical protein